MEKARRRPLIVVVVAMFLGVATVIATAVAASLGFPGTMLDRMWVLNPAAQVGFHVLGRGGGALIALVGVASGTACVGLLREKRWAWVIAIAIFATNMVGDAVSLVVERDWLKSGLGAVIAGVLLLSLSRPSLRDYFAKRPPLT